MGYDYDKKCLNYYLGEIKQKIFDNEDILKLLLNDSENPYDGDSVNEENAKKVVIDNPFSLDEVSKKESCQMNMFVGAGKPFDGNDESILSESIVCFRILCHRNLYNCDYGARPVEIMYKLQKLFNDSKIGVYKMKFKGFQEVRQGDNYAGFDVLFKVLEFRRSSENL